MNGDRLVNGRTGTAVAGLLAVVGLGLTMAQTPTMATAGGMSELAKLAAAGGVDALQQMIDVRSPGLRAPGALTQTKGRRIASMKEAFGPKERVLSNERTRPSDDAPAIAYETGNVPGTDLFTPTPGATALPEGAVSAPAFEPLPPTVGPGSIGGGATPPIIVGGGGGGSGGGGGGTPVTTPTPVPTPTPTPGIDNAIPEPATWLSLMLGFFAMGFGLRGSAARQFRRGLNGRAFQ